MFQQLAFRTSEVVRLKLTLLKGYTWFFGHMQRLSPRERQAEDVRLLASILTYFIQGLIQGPPGMSSSRDMVKDFILARARTFEITSLPPHPLAEDLLRMSGEIIFSTYKILRYTARKNPAGARLKIPLLLQQQQDKVQQLASSAGIESPTQSKNAWSEQDQEWTRSLVDNTLSSWFWGRLSEQDRGRGVQGPLILS
jgi:hypothetical protein